jgi:hypothetical protein
MFKNETDSFQEMFYFEEPIISNFNRINRRAFLKELEENRKGVKKKDSLLEQAYLVGKRKSRQCQHQVSSRFCKDCLEYDRTRNVGKIRSMFDGVRNLRKIANQQMFDEMQTRVSTDKFSVTAIHSLQKYAEDANLSYNLDLLDYIFTNRILLEPIFLHCQKETILRWNNGQIPSIGLNIKEILEEIASELKAGVKDLEFGVVRILIEKTIPKLTLFVMLHFLNIHFYLKVI